MSLGILLAFVSLQAEPAPAEPAPARPEPAVPALPSVEEAPAMQLGVAVRLSHRLDSEVSPENGVSLGATFERRLVALPAGFEASAGLDLFHDRFAEDVPASALVEGVDGPAVRLMSQTSFGGTGAFGWRRGRMRLAAGLGIGASVGYFATDEEAYQPGHTTRLLPFGRILGSVEVEVTRNTFLGLRADLTLYRRDQTITTSAGGTFLVFGDLLAAGLGLHHRF